MKRIVSILISLLMGLSCTVTFIGCEKNSGNSSSTIEDSTDSSSSSSSVEDLSKVLDEYLPVAERLTSNIEDISVADIKNSEGDVMSLVFRDVTVGNIFKNIMQYGSQESPVTIEVNRYKDGKWRSGANATEIDSDLNTIFEYQLFSGPLNISQERLEIVGGKKIVDLLMESFLNTKFSIEKTLALMEKQGEEGTTVGTGVMPIPGFDKLTENKAVYNFVKPLLLLSIEDFYNITVDCGASYIQNTYGTMDIDSYIGLCAYALAASQQGDYEAVSKLLSDLMNGTISQPEFNANLPISDLFDDVLAIFGLNDSEIDALLKGSFTGSVSNPEFIAFDTVNSTVENVGRVMSICGAAQTQIDAVKRLLHDLLIDGEQGGVEINADQKVTVIVAHIPLEENIKTVVNEQFGEMTLGQLFASEKDFTDKIASVIAAVKESVQNTSEEVPAEITDAIERIESLFTIIKKYLDAEDVTSFKLSEVCNDLMLVCEAILPEQYAEISDIVFLMVGNLLMTLLPDYAEVTLAGTGAAFAALDFDETVSKLGGFIKSLMGSDEAMTAQVDSVVAFIQKFANGTLAELQFNSELTVSAVVTDVKSLLTGFGVQNVYVDAILEVLSKLYSETTLVGIVDGTLNLEVDNVIEAVFDIVRIFYAGQEEATVIENALTKLFDGTLAAPTIDTETLAMTVAEFMESVGGSKYLNESETLKKFSGFTLGELMNYEFGKNDELDEVVVEVIKEAVLSFIDDITGGASTEIAA